MQHQSHQPFVYRRLSTAAVSSVVVAVLSPLALLDWSMAIVPLLGIGLGVFAWRQVRRNMDNLAGAGLAQLGLAGSTLMLAAGLGWQGFVYATEVPDGYQRIDYALLQPDPRQSGQVVPPSALQLDGRRVFIKGYVIPGARRHGIRQFLLVRDQGDCCFGSNPTITERIQVTLADVRGMTWTGGVVKLAGVLRVEPSEHSVDRAGGVMYHLDEAMLR
jgi:hypothetical protein